MQEIGSISKAQFSGIIQNGELKVSLSECRGTLSNLHFHSHSRCQKRADTRVTRTCDFIAPKYKKDKKKKAQLTEEGIAALVIGQYATIPLLARQESEYSCDIYPAHDCLHTATDTSPGIHYAAHSRSNGQEERSWF